MKKGVCYPHIGAPGGVEDQFLAAQRAGFVGVEFDIVEPGRGPLTLATSSAKHTTSET